MKCHAKMGSEILQNSESKYLRAGAKIANYHHEKYDGSGYPEGLKGEDIPIFARMVALADVFDALTTKRSYKEAFGFDSSVQYLQEQSAKHFDPVLVELFIRHMREVREIYEEYKE